MSFNLSLTENQIKEILASDSEIGLSFFRDSNGNDIISEGDNFHTRLKFYLGKTGTTRSELLDYFRTNYPTLLSSESGLNHIINGIRTPKLSVVMAMAECLEIAPASLLPGVPGYFITKESDHVELVDNPELFSDESDEDDMQTEDLMTNTIIQEDEYEALSEDELDEIEDQDGCDIVSDNTPDEVSEIIEDTEQPEEEVVETPFEDFEEPVVEYATVDKPEDKEEEEITEDELDDIDDLLNSIF